MAWNKRDAHPIGDRVVWTQHRWQKDLMVPHWEFGGCYTSGYLHPRPRSTNKDTVFLSGYDTSKRKYQCAVCGKGFGSYACIGYYAVMGSHAHMTCIARDMIEKEDS